MNNLSQLSKISTYKTSSSRKRKEFVNTFNIECKCWISLSMPPRLAILIQDVTSFAWFLTEGQRHFPPLLQRARPM